MQIENPENWTQETRCKSCQNNFTFAVSDVKYQDLHPPDKFAPDWQYFVNCPSCESVIVVQLPSNVAIWVQFNQ